jgi:hypothetical protein
MTQSASLDKIEIVACAIEFLAHLIDKDVRSLDGALDAACALAELFERNTFVGYTTIDGRGGVATFQTAVYPRLPTWPFSKVHGVPIKRPYVGTCAQAICERKTITCSNIMTETGFDPQLACGLHGIWPPHSPVRSCIRLRRLPPWHLCHGIPPVTPCFRSRHDGVRRLCVTNHSSKATP